MTSRTTNIHKQMIRYTKRNGVNYEKHCNNLSKHERKK